MNYEIISIKQEGGGLKIYYEFNNKNVFSHFFEEKSTVADIVSFAESKLQEIVKAEVTTKKELDLISMSNIFIK